MSRPSASETELFPLMPISSQHVRSQWSSQIVFILAATGSAVGLGNIWKFPYVVGEHGGGAFILVYLLAVLVILPIMTSEIMIGRRGCGSPVHAVQRLSAEFGLSRAWKGIGFMGVLAGIIILSYYSVIAGWTLAYFFRTGAGTFNQATVDGVAHIFGDLTGSAEKLLAWHTIFMVITAGVMGWSISHGLERVVKYMMPLLFMLLAGLLVYVISRGAFIEAFDYMFVFDFSRLTGAGVLAAMGQAFFSLSLGLGAIMAYGSYLPPHIPIVRATFAIAAMDTLVAVVAGLIVFSLVFQYGLAPGQGPGLVFETLPLAFGAIPGGDLLGGVFFFLLFIAAWTSAVSLVEPGLSWLTDSWRLSRGAAACIIGGVAWLVGLGTVFSFSDAEHWTVFGRTVFDSLDYLASNLLLPFGGLLIALFAGWKLPAFVLREELNIRHRGFYRLWRFMLRYLSPLAIATVFVGLVWPF